MYMCFRSVHGAEHCRSHFASFKSKYGVWPTIDLTQSTEITVKTPIKSNKKSLQSLQNSLEIDIIQEEELFHLGSATGASFMYCHEFGLFTERSNQLNIIFSGQEITIDADHRQYILGLEGCITD
jgi:hypothetical protein